MNGINDEAAFLAAQIKRITSLERAASTPHTHDTLPSAIPVPVSEGGTGASTVAAARTALNIDGGVGNPEIGPWVDMTYLGNWAGVSTDSSRNGLQIREEGPYIRVRGTARLGSGTLTTLQVCELPSWAEPFGSQIIPVCSNASSSVINYFGSVRVVPGGIWISNEGGTAALNTHYMEFRYLRRPPTWQAAPGPSNNYVSISPWLTYSTYSEWLTPSVNTWNGQTTLHGLAASGTVPASNIYNIWSPGTMGPRGGLTEILMGWGYNATSPGALAFRGDAANSNVIAASLMANNLWISPSRMAWVNAGKASPARTAATLTNSWANYNGGYQTAGYVKIDDVVFLSGLVTRAGGASSTSIFTLPPECRPAYKTRIPVMATLFEKPDNAVVLTVKPDGTIVNESGLVSNNTWFSLSGVNFSVTG